MTDVLGVCESWENGVVTVRRKDGSLVEIAVRRHRRREAGPARDLRAHHRLSAEQADRLALPGWQPAETRGARGVGAARLGGFLLARATRSSRSGTPAWPSTRRRPGWRSGTARDRCRRARTFVRRGGWRRLSRSAGWSTYEPTLLMLASVSRVLRLHSGARATRAGQHDAAVDAGWLATDERAARYGEAARSVLEAGEVTFVTVEGRADTVLARGRGAFHGDWVGVSCALDPPGPPRHRSEQRRPGGHCSPGVPSAGPRRRTCRWSWPTTPPEQLYEAHGYEVHHRYDYLVLDT